VLHLADGEWVVESVVGLFSVPFWGLKKVRELQNSVITAD